MIGIGRALGVDRENLGDDLLTFNPNSKQASL